MLQLTVKEKLANMHPLSELNKTQTEIKQVTVSFRLQWSEMWRQKAFITSSIRAEFPGSSIQGQLSHLQDTTYYSGAGRKRATTVRQKERHKIPQGLLASDVSCV